MYIHRSFPLDKETALIPVRVRVAIVALGHEPYLEILLWAAAPCNLPGSRTEYRVRRSGALFGSHHGEESIHLANETVTARGGSHRARVRRRCFIEQPPQLMDVVLCLILVFGAHETPAHSL
ncbi:hypothetical protein RRF57_005110 [Xylaria bambusicola]|uniref:Uncharacterized protein n=1 Tax=Xylaria bambusicola TaxID=326684 RepID=A0AAN7UBT9_9PEZI